MKIAIAHINRMAVAPLNRMLHQLDPALETTIFLNEQPLHEINVAGKITGQSIQDFARLLFTIEPTQYDGILIGCSMFSAHEQTFSPFFDIPIVGIDQAMIQYVASHYQHIGVLATNPTAGEMTAVQIETAGNTRDVHVLKKVVEGAGDYLKVGDEDSYTTAIGKAAAALIAQGVDIIVLAQVSMTVTERRLQSLNIPVISSPSLGLARLKNRVKHQ